VARIRSVADLSGTKTAFAEGLVVALVGVTITWLVVAFGMPFGVGAGLLMLGGAAAAAKPSKPAVILARPGGKRR
jgi:hypothetical protein